MHIIRHLRGVEILHIVAAYLQAFEVRIRRRLQFEIQFIDLGDGVTRGGDADGIGTAVNHRRCIISDCLLARRVSRDTHDSRHLGGTHRKRHLIYRLRGREARDRHSVHRDILQGVIR